MDSRKGLTHLTKFDVNPHCSRNNESICGIRFENANTNSLFVSTVNGKIYLFDLRQPSSIANTFECTESNKKPFTCFDLNADGTILCAGTEQTAGEAYLLFFDIRKSAMLGAYTDSHRDDLTQVMFHPTKPNSLTTGSTDGLINVFDITEQEEDDALECCLNTENSIQKINWHSEYDSNKNQYISCITDTNEFQWFNVDESELELQCDRESVTALIKRKATSHCYLIDCYTDSKGESFLLAGSNSNRGECLRSLTVRNNKLSARNYFVDNKQIVRCSSFDAKVILISTIYFIIHS